MNKHTLIQKIKSISDLTHEEQAELINLVNNTKKYGLVWEDKFEQIEEDLLTKLPVLTEVKERFIEAKPMEHLKGEEDLFTESEEITALAGEERPLSKVEAPNHIIIEGDNLHALTALSFTHKGAIDVIYIDPPYNTGGKDFKYNDTYVDKEDSFRHSKWISFMAKRLKIAKMLLSEEGSIFISIDDIEHAQLKLLCDEIFGGENFIRNIIWHKKYAAASDSKGIPDMHDFVVAYRKSAQHIRNLLPRSGKQNDLYKYDSNDGRGLWRSDNLSVKTYSANYDFDITNPLTGEKFRPPKGRAWITNQDRIQEWISEGRIFFGKTGLGAPQLKRYLQEVQKGVVPTSYWGYDEVGHNDASKKELKEILHERSDGGFSTPKPVELIKKVILISSSRNSKILDFFAGSGTTLHATVKLNSEDGGNRQCILVTNNENNICEEVTYERNKRVIQGYTNAKGVDVPGLTNNNLRYYKCDYVPSAKTEANRRRLTEASTDLLCIKENCYINVTKMNGLNPKLCRLYTNEGGKYMAIVYHSRNQHEVNEQMCQVIANLQNLSSKVKLYGFSPEVEVLLEDFYDVKDRVHAVPLPDAIYNAYRSTFKSINLGKRKMSEQVEAASQLEETNLFNQETNQD
jgi:adenine-specific DNA-methyltransferase